MEVQLGKVQSDKYNNDIMMRYYKVRTTQVNLATVLAEFVRLVMISKILDKKFEDTTTEDIENLVYIIDKRKNSDNTKNKFRKVLKAFYRWMKKYPKGQFPPEVQWITLKKLPLITVKADDLLSYDECIKITEKTLNLRDKALLQCLLDAGCRIGEMLTVRVGEVEFNDGGAVLRCDGKTGEGSLILTWSSKILAVWFNNHPFRDNPQAPLWPQLGKSTPVQLQYHSVRKILGDCKKRAGCKKRMWLHMLKHVSSTQDALNGMPDSFRRYKHHWTQNSRMPQVYEHLSASVIPNIQNETWKKIDGRIIDTKQNIQNTILIVKCRRCDFENPRDSVYCNKCSFPLNDRMANEINISKKTLETMIEKLSKDPKKFEALLSIIRD